MKKLREKEILEEWTNSDATVSDNSSKVVRYPRKRGARQAELIKAETELE